MADVKKTIDIIFAGVDNLSGTVNTVSGKMSSFGDQVGNVSEPLANISDSILKLDAALIAISIGGLAYAFTKSKDYESSIIDLEKVMGDQEEITKELEETFTSLGRTYGESTIGIVDSLAGLRQSGYSTAEGIEVLETSLKLARASELSTEEATNLLKRSMIGYNLTTKDAIGLGDLWNQTSNVANTTVGKLAEGFAIVSRQAKDSGFSMTELSGALTPMIGVFDSGSEAGIAMSMTLTKLLNPTKEGEVAIRELTGATGPLNEAFKSGRDIFEAVARGLQNVDARTGSVAVAQIVGAQQAKRIKVSFDDYFKTLEKIGPVSAQYNSLQGEVDKQNASTQASVDRLVSGFESLAITIGEQFRGSAKEAIDGGTAIENALENIIKDDTFAPVFDALSSFGSGVGDYLKGIAIAMPEAFENVDWSGLLKALDSIGGKFGELFKDIDLTKPEELTKVIQFVIDSLESLITTTEGIIGPIGIFIKTIISWVENFNNLDAGSKKAAGAVLGWGKVVNTVIEPLQSLLRAAQALAVGVTALTSIKVVSWVAGFAGLSAIVIPAGIAIGITAIGASIGMLSAKIAESVGIPDLIEKIFPSDLPERIETTQEEFDKMHRIIKEINDTIDDVQKIEPIDIKAMLADDDYTDLEISYAITGDLSDLERALAETGALVKEERSVNIDTEKANEKIINTKKEIEEIPSEKLLEISLKGEIDTEIAGIKTRAETIQNSVEWTAKLNIAEAESSARMFVSVIEGISNSITSTGDLLGSLFSTLTGENIDTSTKWDIEAQIEEESKMRKDAHESQMKLSEVQKDYMKAKTEAMESGEGLINITADGLEPEIEAFMWKILEKIQIRANELSSEFLLGV